jgi:pimeloyl-ACP methyl ester carboxylesterase
MSLPVRTGQLSWRSGAQESVTSFDVVGEGRAALLLPALSSIGTREEMRPLASRLGGRFQCLIPDWPGFGNAPRAQLPVTVETMRRFLRAFIDRQTWSRPIAVAAGHAAPYLVEAAREHPSLFERLVLIAPTWRGPLPTAMGEDRRPLYGRIRRLIEMPVLGQALYRVNVSAPVVARMMRAHVYAEPAHVDAGLLAAKLAVTRRERARFATAAFVTGELDPVRSREAWLALFADGLPPTLVLRPASAPPRSTAEIDALIASGRVHAAEVRGALAAHEEYPDDAAAAILGFVGVPD